jgi:hypothetical protein
MLYSSLHRGSTQAVSHGCGSDRKPRKYYLQNYRRAISGIRNQIARFHLYSFQRHRRRIVSAQAEPVESAGHTHAGGIAWASEASIRARVDMASLAMRWPVALRRFAHVLVGSASTVMFAILVIVARFVMVHATGPSTEIEITPHPTTLVP